jgi:pimeloyl-ACP methyl ester carboxylesterase
MAKDVLALLDFLEWRSDVHIVGFSMGKHEEGRLKGSSSP